MVDTPVVRRSGRTRTAVTSYADEQAQATAMSAPPAKRKKTAGKTARLLPKDEMPEEAAIKSQPDDEWTDTAIVKAEPLEDEDDFQPAPKKKAKKSTKKVKAIGKLDAEGVMRLDTTMQRPKGEKMPPRVYEVPPRDKAAKGTSFNLSAILAENFEQRFERKKSKIPRLGPGQPEVRLKK